MRALRTLFDHFTLALLAVVFAAVTVPAEGHWVTFFDVLTKLGIGLLFFFHGAKLSPEAVRSGAGHWRLHGVVFFCTFVMFPLLGIALRPVVAPWLGPELSTGLLYLCVLPATVQSAIAFTSIARGNVSAAICSAAASSVLGIFLTPMLVLMLLGVDGATAGFDAVTELAMQLLAPFMLGQFARRWIAAWVTRHRGWVAATDQGSILLVVYTAFSEATVLGLWNSVPWTRMLILAAVCCVLLALVLWLTHSLANVLGFNIEDRITIVFGGSKKSMATGVPMAQILFTGGTAGAVILPLMIFHQLQLMVCAVLAQRYARREADPPMAAGTH